MKKAILILLWLLCVSALPSFAAEDPFKVVYRQDNVVNDGLKTSFNLMINVINLSGDEARSLMVTIPGQNPFLPMDMPVFVGTIPDGHQSEVLQQAKISNALIALSDPEENLLWRVEYTNSAGEKTFVDVKGERGI